MNQRSKPTRPVLIVAKLYEMRNRARLLMGERYGEEMRRLRRVIEVVQNEHGGSPLSAATKICQVVASITDGLDVVIIMAAAVEMIEPSEEEGSRA